MGTPEQTRPWGNAPQQPPGARPNPPHQFLKFSSLSLPPQGKVQGPHLRPWQQHHLPPLPQLPHDPRPQKLKLSPNKSGVATATLGFTTAIRKHQDNVLSLLCSFTGTAAISASRIGQLRADNVALMTSTTICVQQTGGTCFSLKRLYIIARAEEKVAHQLFAKEAFMTTATNTATGMSSIMDLEKFTTVSCCGVGSSSPPPKQRPQSCSPPCPGDNIKTINPFDDSFLTSFPPLGGHAPALPGETGNLSDPEQQK
jgi:hypothetical protein